LELAQTRLEEAEQWLTGGPHGNGETAEMIVVDQARFQGLPAAISVARAYITMAYGDLSGSVAYARQTLDLLPEDEFRWRSIAQVFLGIAYWESGELELAYESLGDFVADMARAGDDDTAVISIAAILAEIRMVQGRLGDAVRLLEHALRLATKEADRVVRGTAELYVGLGELYAERGDLETAEEYLGKKRPPPPAEKGVTIEPSSPARMDPAAVDDIVSANFGLFAHCYRGALERRPGLAGVVRLRFIIGGRGNVMSVRDAGSELPDGKLVDCVAEGFYALSFPKAPGDEVRVLYRLVFDSGLSG
jgi:tetratricopeptide (TPR) repeat protein